MSFSWGQLQEEHLPWVRHNFPDVSSVEPLLGVLEELGELTAAVQDGDHARIEDAAADAMIYMAHYCNARGWNLCDITLSSTVRSNGLLLVQTVGRLCRAHLKTMQRIRLNEAHDSVAKDCLAELVQYLFNVGRKWSFDLLSTTERVWHTIVRKRDWQANSIDGSNPQEDHTCGLFDDGEITEPSIPAFRRSHE